MPETTRREGVHGLSLPVRARSKEIWSAYWLQWDCSGQGRRRGWEERMIKGRQEEIRVRALGFGERTPL